MAPRGKPTSAATRAKQWFTDDRWIVVTSAFVVVAMTANVRIVWSPRTARTFRDQAENRCPLAYVGWLCQSTFTSLGAGTPPR